MNNCEYCNKTLKSIGNQRKNGKKFIMNVNNSNDWNDRKYHKKCYIEYKKEQKILDQLAKYSNLG